LVLRFVRICPFGLSVVLFSVSFRRSCSPLGGAPGLSHPVDAGPVKVLRLRSWLRALWPVSQPREARKGDTFCLDIFVLIFSIFFCCSHGDGFN